MDMLKKEKLVSNGYEVMQLSSSMLSALRTGFSDDVLDAFCWSVIERIKKHIEEMERYI